MTLQYYTANYERLYFWLGHSTSALSMLKVRVNPTELTLTL